jgi:hypothetical protein
MANNADIEPGVPEKKRDIAPDEYIELIRRRAHDIYLERGGVDGRDLDDWLQAEKEVRRDLGLDG